jgi:hypothetical protein
MPPAQWTPQTCDYPDAQRIRTYLAIRYPVPRHQRQSRSTRAHGVCSSAVQSHRCGTLPDESQDTAAPAALFARVNPGVNLIHNNIMT